MEPHSPKTPRYSDTPPGSPKSCMKGTRKLTFDKPSEITTTTTGTNPSPIPSPKRSPKSVSIRMHDDGGGGSGEGSTRGTSFDLPSTSSEATAGPSSGRKKDKAPPEIQFQFQLTQHYDQSTPPPNCTSNGNYDFEPEPGTSTSTTYDDPRKDPQLMEIANRFVNDIIENAKIEAANRSKTEPSNMAAGTSVRDSFANGMGRGAAGMFRRAHGVVSTWFTKICVRAQNIRADLK